MIIKNVFFTNNLYLSSSNWPTKLAIQDENPFYGNPYFSHKGGVKIEDYIPTNIVLIKNKGIQISKIPNDSIELKIGLQVEKDILGKLIKGRPDIGAFEIN